MILKIIFSMLALKKSNYNFTSLNYNDKLKNDFNLKLL